VNSNQDKSLKKAIIFRIMLIVAGALLAFVIAMIIAIPHFNRQSARDTARSHLAIFGAYLETRDDFENLVNLTDGDLLITVIGLDGMVVADTREANPLDMYRGDRPEVRAVLTSPYSIGQSIRRSETSRVDFLYMAKMVDANGADVVLRVAIPVRNINAHLWSLIGVMAVIFVLVLLAVLLVTPKMAKSITAPISMIKQKLETIGKPEKSPIILTRHDEINKVLLEIDEISEKLSGALTDYQTEKQKLKLVLENIDQGIIAIDDQKRIVSSNKHAEEYFCFEFVEPILIEKVIRNRAILDNINQAIAQSKFISYDHTRVSGQIFAIRYFPVNMNNIRLVITVQNVTDMRKVSIEKQDFFVNASHELNTPLSSILGYAEILKNEKKFNAGFVDTIYSQASRMKALIGDMLALSELEEGAEFPEETIDLKELATQVLTAHKPKASGKNIKLILKAEPVTITANKEKITEVISNLVDNSIKYTDTEGTVSVSIKEQNNKVILKVKDNGIGIAPKHLNRVFERFYRTDKGRSRIEGGTGLGLAIVKHICNIYNAELKINSKENIGTEVVIEFSRD